MITLRNVPTICQAIEILKEKGIKFDRALATYEHQFNYWTKEKESVGSPVIIYFMSPGANCDVAYYFPEMGTLSIHDQPRWWDEEIIKDYTVYPVVPNI